MLALLGSSVGATVLLSRWSLAAPGQNRTATSPSQFPEFSGIYPHLAYYNDEGECGTGAVVPWADRLWVITYGPHLPNGSSDKLYEITSDLKQIVRPESVGGTPADRLIHRESNQLFIGPYAIDSERQVRVITPKMMPGRLTGAARHLTDPAGKIYFATMEEGIYEVDVKTLAVTELYQDTNSAGQAKRKFAELPGYHGKGLYSGQGVLVYANNGEYGEAALSRPETPSGVLAEWDGTDWKVVRRNQFTEVTGPGGITGNSNPAADPIWSIGWDHRSLIFMLRDGGKWHSFRLPKASHAYDGAHGWNTEWPRIRDVGTPQKPDFLMTMHGMFWRFPQTFSLANSAGIRPRSAYLKVIGDFTRWNDRLVFGCDDAAKSAFLNTRNITGKIAGPGQSNSNLWFTDFATPDQLGPTHAEGAVWLRDAVKKGEVSEPFLIAGWPKRIGHFVNGGAQSLVLQIETGNGKGQWTKGKSVAVPANGYAWLALPASEKGEWIRVTAGSDCAALTVQFAFSDADNRARRSDAIFDGLARISDTESQSGLVWARGENKRTLLIGAQKNSGAQISDVGVYELDGAMNLSRSNETDLAAKLKETLAIPRDVVQVDAASVLIVDDQKRRWLLPKGDAAYDALTRDGAVRLAREAVTERDLLNCHGTFYELPAENADGFAKMRPIASHDLRLHDYCSFRGLLILSGVKSNATNPHIIRSADGNATLWAGAIDDLWKLGKPTGQGGPWKNSEVEANAPSDPYLMFGYDAKALQLSHDAAQTVAMKVEVDLTGTGLWVTYQTFPVAPGKTTAHSFPAEFSARWLRVSADQKCRATAWLVYS